jgi:hypothetical protein
MKTAAAAPFTPHAYWCADQSKCLPPPSFAGQCSHYFSSGWIAGRTDSGPTTSCCSCALCPLPLEAGGRSASSLLLCPWPSLLGGRSPGPGGLPTNSLPTVVCSSRGKGVQGVTRVLAAHDVVGVGGQCVCVWSMEGTEANDTCKPDVELLGRRDSLNLTLRQLSAKPYHFPSCFPRLRLPL